MRYLYYDSVGISLRKNAHRYSAEAYDTEITGSISLDDSLFLAKRSINDLLRDLLRKKEVLNIFRSSNYLKKIE